jgi:hypothetical protein
MLTIYLTAIMNLTIAYFNSVNYCNLCFGFPLFPLSIFLHSHPCTHPVDSNRCLILPTVHALRSSHSFFFCHTTYFLQFLQTQSCNELSHTDSYKLDYLIIWNVCLRLELLNEVVYAYVILVSQNKTNPLYKICKIEKSVLQSHQPACTCICIHPCQNGVLTTF